MEGSKLKINSIGAFPNIQNKYIIYAFSQRVLMGGGRGWQYPHHRNKITKTLKTNNLTKLIKNEVMKHRNKKNIYL